VNRTADHSLESRTAAADLIVENIIRLMIESEVIHRVSADLYARHPRQRAHFIRRHRTAQRWCCSAPTEQCCNRPIAGVEPGAHEVLVKAIVRRSTLRICHSSERKRLPVQIEMECGR
jgi:hypothetical protein